MFLNVRLREHLGFVTRGLRSYESSYVEALRSLIKPGDTVFDIGANIGFYSVLFSKWVGPHGRVIAFEPDPNNTSLLQANLKANSCENTVVRELALGRTVGEEIFSVDRVTGSTGHLGGGPTYGDSLFGNGHEVTLKVKTNTLDVEAELGVPPNILKLDIEGGEFDVLCGGSKLLDRHRPLIISEMSSWNEDVNVAATKPAQATQFLYDHGYKVWNLDTGQVLLPGASVWMILAVPCEQVERDEVVGLLKKIRATEG